MAITAKDIWQRAKHLPKVPIEGAAADRKRCCELGRASCCR